jgi:surfeit locus 1 family protein
VKRFPVGLTVAAAIGLAVLLGLGVWQLKRLAWKQDLLARIAALQHAPPRPVGEVLAHAARGEDVAFLRVSAACGQPAGQAPIVFRYALRDGAVGWRLMGFCPLTEGPWSGIVLDRGLVNRLAGQMAPTAQAFPAAQTVIGVLRAPGGHSSLEAAPRRAADGAVILQSVDAQALALVAGPGARPAPYYLAAETATPAAAGLTPAALPQDIPNNHFVYALTWFGLAGVLAWTWAAYVWRRMRGS